MRSSLSLVSLSMALGATAEPWSDGRKYGSSFYSGPTSNAYITKATYSVVPPDTPCNYHTELPQGELSLWVGVQDDPTYKDLVDMNLVQPLAIPTGSQLDFEISVNPETTKIDQKVWISGTLVSSKSDSAGMEPAVFYGFNECVDHSCGTLKAYSWSNITVHLSDADENYGNTFSLFNAASDGPTTSDGGKTWHIDSIEFAKDYLYEDDSVQECY
ncbi:hypothetical protein DIS24_g623 [Lasiodiplodia hormozganensis]|uniref:Ubiquitin 3 binding protein But2 C-terminal domain-containing protein n=1 Tax=Lasiodiplodia hormozganensis TaxID=869390 RepID=A0AA39Z5R5_9PEZI|nr:hypothetical protein DIS24_g623 [Lasiodiplodia hormozganensis]